MGGKAVLFDEMETFARALAAVRLLKDEGVVEEYAIAEHIMIAGVPVQIIPAPSDVAAEAVANAVELDYEGIRTRVIRPEYLIALYLEPGARTGKRLARVEALLEEAELDRGLLEDILARYNLNLPELS